MVPEKQVSGEARHFEEVYITLIKTYMINELQCYQRSKCKMRLGAWKRCMVL